MSTFFIRLDRTVLKNVKAAIRFSDLGSKKTTDHVFRSLFIIDGFSRSLDGGIFFCITQSVENSKVTTF